MARRVSDIQRVWPGMSRAFFRETADCFTDCFTAGLWEMVGTPAEIIAGDDEQTVTVTHDAHDTVTSFDVVTPRQRR